MTFKLPWILEHIEVRLLRLLNPMTTVAKRNQQQLIFVIVHSLVFESCCVRQTLLGASYPTTMPNQKAAPTTKTCGNGYVCSFEKVAPDTICLSSVGLSGNSLRSVRGICIPTALQRAQHSQLCRTLCAKTQKAASNSKALVCKGPAGGERKDRPRVFCLLGSNTDA